MLFHLSKPKVAAVWALIALTGALAGWLGYRGERASIMASLVDDAKRCAVAFDATELRRLKGTKDDLASPVYQRMKERLIALQGVNRQVRFVYIFRSLPETRKAIFLGDSAKPGARDESLPGDDYPQAAESPGLQEIIRTGQPATEGPLKDDFGTWVTGYVTIEDKAPVAGTAGRQIVGLDIDADDWSRALWGAALRNALYAWVVLGMPFSALLMMRRQFDQREAIRNLSEAMEQSHSALMIVDLGSCIEYANRGLCNQMGYSRRELIGRKWRDFQTEETPPEMLAELVTTVRSGKTWEGEWSNRRKDGTTYPVRGVITPVKRRDGELACFIAVFDDMTEIKRKEAELRDARDQAEAGDRAKGQFLATMSHEVRTPLNGIVGFTNLLLDTSLNPEQRDYVQTIRSSGEALIQLTGDILDYARIESGKLALEPAACDPRECVEEALDLFATAATAKKIEMLHWIDEDVPTTVLADGGRLRQVLVNLVNNAVKFTERGSVEVTVAVARDLPAALDASQITLRFSVRDSGMGIPADQYAKLFKPFSQLDGTSTRKFGGTGLGLAICRNLVHLMGGEISFNSEAGQGSLFTFVVPLPVIEPAKLSPELSGLRLAVISPPGGLRTELTRLATRWHAQLIEVESAAQLHGVVWDTALVEIDESLARALATPEAPPLGIPSSRTFGLVPISLSTELRNGLRSHFRLLVNKPVHHGALYALLSGLRTAPVLHSRPPAHFDLRVLLVEDNVVNQRLMQKVLTNLGCKWVVAENGRRGIEELAKADGQFDFVLMDLHMPELDGIAAICEIRDGRAGEKARDIWIAALTADARDDQRERVMVAGANDYLTKPMRQPEIDAALRRFRDARRPGR
jgi:PAS domain S-box-containing protein